LKDLSIVFAPKFEWKGGQGIQKRGGIHPPFDRPRARETVKQAPIFSAAAALKIDQHDANASIFTLSTLACMHFGGFDLLYQNFQWLASQRLNDILRTTTIINFAALHQRFHIL
jgi:hypothetical protein